MYKLVNALSKNMGDSGGQKLIGTVSKLDAQGISAFLKNVVVTVQLNEGDGDAGGITLYLTTGDNWDDDHIITARAVPGYGGTVSLTAMRSIEADAERLTSNEGQIYLWAEMTDISYTSDVYLRMVIETWGYFVEFDEA